MDAVRRTAASSSSSTSSVAAAAAITTTSYTQLICTSPLSHKVFVLLVLLQCVLLFAERLTLLGIVLTANPPEPLQAVYDAGFYAGVILISTIALTYYGIHSVLLGAWGRGVVAAGCGGAARANTPHPLLPPPIQSTTWRWRRTVS